MTDLSADLILATAREMFFAAMVAVVRTGECPDEGRKWLDWNQLDQQRLDGWIALAKWHLERVSFLIGGKDVVTGLDVLRQIEWLYEQRKAE